MGTNKVIQLRHDLHRHPELSSSEAATSQRIARFFEPLHPDETWTGLGGHGLAFGFGNAQTGPTVMLRCELDALPITEIHQTAHRSLTEGISHQCGHDGHMAIIAAVGESLSRQRPTKGRVVLLYQPAEETGAGAAAVLADPRLAQIRPDFVFALHNLPGFPMGQLLVRTGTFSCASRGMEIRLTGRTAHAAQPETGISPAVAMCRIIDEFHKLPPGLEVGTELAFVTVVGAQLGKKAFGTAPGDAAVLATLRSETDITMDRMVRRSEEMVRSIASAEHLDHTVSYEDVYPSTQNSQAAVDTIRKAAGTATVQVVDAPFRWSEDFGRFTAVAEGALFGLGAGEKTIDLHSPDYDFPDELIESGSNIFQRIVRECLGS